MDGELRKVDFYVAAAFYVVSPKIATTTIQPRKNTEPYVVFTSLFPRNGLIAETVKRKKKRLKNPDFIFCLFCRQLNPRVEESFCQKSLATASLAARRDSTSHVSHGDSIDIFLPVVASSLRRKKVGTVSVPPGNSGQQKQQKRH